MTKPKRDDEQAQAEPVADEAAGDGAAWAADPEQAEPPVVDDAPTPMTRTYKVTGPQRVHGVSRGGTLDLDPDAVSTRFLVVVGHICPVAGADTQED